MTVPTGAIETCRGSKDGDPRKGPDVRYTFPVHVVNDVQRPSWKVYHSGRFAASYTYHVPKSPCSGLCVSEMPQPDSLGVYQRPV